MEIDTDGEYLSDSDSNEARQIPRKKHHRYYLDLIKIWVIAIVAIVL